MERKLHEPLTLPKHPELLHEINEMIINIKVWHVIDLQKESEQTRDQLMSNHPNPNWDEVVDLLGRCRNAINEQREDPRRY